jgi:type I restriction enzyme S subunit
MINQVMEEKILSIDKSKWKLTKLGTLAEDISVRVDKPGDSEYDRFVGLDNFVSGDIKIKSWASTKNLTSSAKAFKAGDILFARRNAYLRRASLVDFDGCCSGDAFVIRENRDKVVPGYLAFLMNTNALWDYANSNAAGTMSKRVKWRDLEEYEFLLPPKAEQERLAELLWAMNDVIEMDLAVLEKLKVQNETFLKELFHKKHDSEICVGEEFYSISGFPYKSELFNGIGLGRKLMRGINIKENGFLWDSQIDRYYDHADGNEEKYMVKKGDILVPMDGSKLGLNFARVTENEEACLLVQRNALFRTENELLANLFMSYLSSRYFHNFIAMNNTTSAIPHISMGQLRSIKLPTLTKEICECTKSVVEIFRLIREFESKISRSESLQKSLINQIF